MDRKEESLPTSGTACWAHDVGLPTSFVWLDPQHLSGQQSAAAANPSPIRSMVPHCNIYSIVHTLLVLLSSLSNKNPSPFHAGFDCYLRRDGTKQACAESHRRLIGGLTA